MFAPMRCFPSASGKVRATVLRGYRRIQLFVIYLWVCASASAAAQQQPTALTRNPYECNYINCCAERKTIGGWDGECSWFVVPLPSTRPDVVDCSKLVHTATDTHTPINVMHAVRVHAFVSRHVKTVFDKWPFSLLMRFVSMVFPLY